MAGAARVSARDLRAAPNVVTLLRLALVAPAILLLANGLRLWAAAVVVVMFATDGLDGYLARRLGRITELGKVLDPTADKVAVGSLLLYLLVAGEFPLWAFALVILRDVAIAVGGVAIARRTGSVPQALPAGKLALAALAAVVVVFVADISALEPAGIAVLLVAVLASGTVYAISMTRALRGGVARRHRQTETRR
jgi:CDP-diacylglycerol--glycerol-3-phosphate 3-phosphatidyltransferase